MILYASGSKKHRSRGPIPPPGPPCLQTELTLKSPAVHAKVYIINLTRFKMSGGKMSPGFVDWPPDFKTGGKFFATRFSSQRIKCYRINLNTRTIYDYFISQLCLNEQRVMYTICCMLSKLIECTVV